MPKKTTPRPPKSNTLRILGGLMLAVVIAESLLGSALMSQKPFAAVALAAHILGALITIGVAAWAFRVAFHLPGWRPRASAALASIGSVGATVAGATFLLGGETRAALDWMGDFDGVLIVAAILLLIWGSVSLPTVAAAEA